jgi:CRP-like cAMP-binding protein
LLQRDGSTKLDCRRYFGSTSSTHASMHTHHKRHAKRETSNRLLRCLPEDQLRRLWPRFERVALKPRRVLSYQDTPMDHAYFVEDGLVSVLANTGGGKSVEVWLIGREGFVGVPLLLGESNSAHRRVVQVAGHALRIQADDLRDTVENAGPLRTVLLRYVQAVLIQTSQLGGCQAHHTLQQRLARWLLMAQDRCGKDALPLTHEMLSRMLGVRRATVSECIAALEQQEILGRARSLIRIMARERLEAIACPCYAVIRSADKSLRRVCEANHTKDLARS